MTHWSIGASRFWRCDGFKLQIVNGEGPNYVGVKQRRNKLLSRYYFGINSKTRDQECRRWKGTSLRSVLGERSSTSNLMGSLRMSATTSFQENATDNEGRTARFTVNC